MDSLKLKVYRIVATLITITPMALEVYTKGSIITSFIIVPWISLTLAGIAIAIDAKFEKIIHQKKEVLQKIEISQKNTIKKEALPMLEKRVNKEEVNKLHHAA